jgi:hypothetical protein
LQPFLLCQEIRLLGKNRGTSRFTTWIGNQAGEAIVVQWIPKFPLDEVIRSWCIICLSPISRKTTLIWSRSFVNATMSDKPTQCLRLQSVTTSWHASPDYVRWDIFAGRKRRPIPGSFGAVLSTDRLGKSSVATLTDSSFFFLTASTLAINIAQWLNIEDNQTWTDCPVSAVVACYWLRQSLLTATPTLQ